MQFRSTFSTLLAAAVLLLAAVPAAAQESSGTQPSQSGALRLAGSATASVPERGGVLRSDSSLIDVVASAFPDEVSRGEIVHLDFGVFNISTDTTVQVLLLAQVVYSNGLRRRLFPPTLHTLGPGDGVISFTTTFVPQRAGLGEARVEALAIVGRATARVPMLARFDRDSDTFTVVP